MRKIHTYTTSIQLSALMNKYILRMGKNVVNFPKVSHTHKLTQCLCSKFRIEIDYGDHLKPEREKSAFSMRLEFALITSGIL